VLSMTPWRLQVAWGVQPTSPIYDPLFPTQNISRAFCIDFGGFESRKLYRRRDLIDREEKVQLLYSWAAYRKGHRHLDSRFGGPLRSVRLTYCMWISISSSTETQLPTISSLLSNTQIIAISPHQLANLAWPSIESASQGSRLAIPRIFGCEGQNAPCHFSFWATLFHLAGISFSQAATKGAGAGGHCDTASRVLHTMHRTRLVEVSSSDHWTARWP
jgi:hypothetical protein